MYFKGAIIFVDPCDFILKEDWKKSKCSTDLEILGLKTFINKSNLYGNCFSNVYKSKTDPEKFIEHLWNNINIRSQTLAKFGYNSEEYSKYNNYVKYLYDQLEDLGEIYHESGNLTVCLLKEILEYNPSFDKEECSCTTIPNFEGNIEYYIDNFQEPHLVSRDNNLLTLQTSF